MQTKEGNFIKEGFDEELDKIRNMRDNSKSLILEIKFICLNKNIVQNLKKELLVLMTCFTFFDQKKFF